MMRFPLMAGGVLAMLLSAFAWAQPYAGGGLTAPRSKAAGATPQTGLTLSSEQGDKRTNEWKVYGSYQFTEHWGAEVHYNDKGRKNGANSVGANPLTPTTSLWNLAATGTMPLARGFSLTGKVGYARSDIAASPYCLSAACGPITGGKRELPYAGIGLGYTFSQAWGLRFEYENANTMRLDGDPSSTPTKGDNWSARIKYTF